MQLRNTLIFIPQGLTEPVAVKIFVAEKDLSENIWNVDTNEVLLSPTMYSHWRSLRGNQLLQGKFFTQLKKVSSTQIRDKTNY